MNLESNLIKSRIKIEEDGKTYYVENYLQHISYFKDEHFTIRHRENGPAIEHWDGEKEWWVSGKRHRESGPAIECSDGAKYYYLNGLHYTEEEYWGKIRFEGFV